MASRIAPVKPVGQSHQTSFAPLYRADGSITAGSTPQLALGRSPSRSYLVIQNNSSGVMFVEIGCAQASCTISGGVVNSVTITNAGFGFTYPPVVQFLGGGTANNNGRYLGLGQPNAPVPTNGGGAGGRQARGIAVLTSGAVSSILIEDGGKGYVTPPYVHLYNDDLDPNGAALPAANVGLLLGAGSKLEWNGACCPTDPIAIWGPTTGAAYLLRWMD
jgi:hypothetical protein